MAFKFGQVCWHCVIHVTCCLLPATCLPLSLRLDLLVRAEFGCVCVSHLLPQQVAATTKQTVYLFVVLKG